MDGSLARHGVERSGGNGTGLLINDIIEIMLGALHCPSLVWRYRYRLRPMISNGVAGKAPLQHFLSSPITTVKVGILWYALLPLAC